jgi:hypothetical protein
MHCIICNVLYAIYYMQCINYSYCILCIVYLHFIICNSFNTLFLCIVLECNVLIIVIVFYALYAMHCMLCIVLYAIYSTHYFYILYYMHCIICTASYALYSIHYILLILFYELCSVHIELTADRKTIWHFDIQTLLCLEQLKKSIYTKYKYMYMFW